MDINYQPESCPQCGIHFQEYCNTLNEDFEVAHASELAKMRSTARHKGIVKGLIKGLAIGTVFVSLSWGESETVGYWEHVRLFFSQHPYIVFFCYAPLLILFVLIDGVGKVDSREEQRMWGQFEQERRQQIWKN